MPVTPAYYINILLALFPDVYQRIANHFLRSQAHFALFSFAFIGKKMYAPAANTVAGRSLFFKGIA
ncbi:hypothetical protein [Niastella sp. OAS944]|uniref:hypothetical protein n=1 Tax=Niastella sp. OAS944 TaxID=2664089 RepID=UPI00348B0BDE|nr:hypothetical protein [Chitinophagaceae bacterium OAS944]